MVLARRTALLIAVATATLAIALAALYSSSRSTADAAGKTVAISIKNYKYSKAKITIKVGTKVTWTNKDEMRHNATSSKAGGPKGPLLDQGKSYTWTAKKVGTFKYSCSPHPFMKGTVVVTK